MAYKGFSQAGIRHWQGGQRRIGLTGGIASGKSSVGTYLAQKGLPVLDADEFARSALTPSTPLTLEIIAHFGAIVRNPDASINRRVLGNLIFQDPSARHWLEQRVHPIVVQRFKEALRQLSSKATIVLMVPLLFEAGMEGLCSEVWLVHCEPEQQLKRLMQRDNLTYRQAQARIVSQWPTVSKNHLVDAVISNSGTLDSWQKRVDHLLDPDS